MKIPLKINPFELCARGTLLEGAVPVKDLDRLSDLLANDSGTVTLQLQFQQQAGRPLITGQLATTLMLTCQRCGKEMSCDINLPIRLCPVRTDDRPAGLPAEIELWLVPDEMALTQDLVQEELLLGLPMIPKHEQGKCPVTLPNHF